ncbi:MAG: dihydropteridine reductase [Clostridia bacterium]|nr:dihydropteridine reductase [Clostridia bacterium]
METKEIKMARRISAEYSKPAHTELDELRELDKRVKRPALIFSYIFGSLGAIIMGMGMSLIMTDIGAIIGLGSGLALGVIIGVLGLAIVSVNYPMHKAMLESRKRKYGAQILALSSKIMNDQA